MRLVLVALAAVLTACACLGLTPDETKEIAGASAVIAHCEAVGRACKADGGTQCYGEYRACMTEGGL